MEKRLDWVDVRPSSVDRLPEKIELAGWGTMMLDTALWQPVIQQIGTAVGLHVDQETVAGYPGSSAVFVVGEDAVVKLFPPFFARDFEVELGVYQLLDGRIKELPRLIAIGTYHDRIDWPFLVTRFCPGAPIRSLFSKLSADHKLEIARQTGLALRQVHATPLEAQVIFAPWSEFLAERHKQCITELHEKTSLPPSLLTDIDTFLAQMVPWLAREPGVLINADLTDDHALLVENGGDWRLEAIIDWGDAEVAHPAYEWIAAWFGFCRRDPLMFKTLVTACQPQQRFDRIFGNELLACTFLHRFGALIIKDLWRGDPLQDQTLAGLQSWLWPL